MNLWSSLITLLHSPSELSCPRHNTGRSLYHSGHQRYKESHFKCCPPWLSHSPGLLEAKLRKSRKALRSMSLGLNH